MDMGRVVHNTNMHGLVDYTEWTCMGWLVDSMNMHVLRGRYIWAPAGHTRVLDGGTQLRKDGPVRPCPPLSWHDNHQLLSVIFFFVIISNIPSSHQHVVVSLTSVYSFLFTCSFSYLCINIIFRFLIRNKSSSRS